MFFNYFLVLLTYVSVCWSYLLLPNAENYRAPQQNPRNFKDVGEPLILTPFLKSNQTSKARKLSAVNSLFNDTKVVSNAGFFTVDEKYNSNLFFWFFRKESSDWQKAPLLLWLQGGPGCSSLFGLFEENGPFTVTEDGLKKRKYSWTKDYNIIYIDQPVGTGFSFTNSSDGYISTQEKVADHLYIALTQFFQLYPELKKNAFYITGESYAGKYIPAIGYRIHSLKKTNATDINLKGLFMISAYMEGLCNGLTNFCIQIGIVDSALKASLEKLEGIIQLLIKKRDWSHATNLSGVLSNRIVSLSNVSIYDFTKPNEDDLEKVEYVSFLEDVKIREKIHVGNEMYSVCNFHVNDYFSEDMSKSVVPWVEELIDHYPVAFVGGQFDVRVPYPLVVRVMKKLNWTGASDYAHAERKIFGNENVDGYIKSAGNLKDVLIRKAGHTVPKDQPRATFNLLNKFVNDEL